MATANAGNIINFVHFDFRCSQFRDETFVVGTSESGMRLPGWPKICFDPEMHLNATAFKPTATAVRQFRWLRDLVHSEQISVETPRCSFFASRHGELNMINGNEWRIHVNCYRKIILAGSLG